MRIGRLIDNVGVLLLRQLTTWALTLMLLRFLPELLGAEGLGKITFAASLIAMLMVVTNLGTGTYITKRISIRDEGWSDLFWNTCLIRLVLGGAVLAVGVRVLAELDLDSTTRGVLYFTGLTVVVAALGKAAEATIQGLENMRWLSLSEVANKATTVLLGIGLLQMGFGVVTFAGVVLLGYTVSLAVMVFALARSGLQKPRLNPRIVWDTVIGGMPFLMATAVLQLYLWCDVTLLTVLTHDEVVGWYGAALQIYTTLNFLPLIFATALLPPLSQLFARGDRSALLDLARNSLALIFLVSLPMAVGLAILADSAIGALGYPDEFHPSVIVLRILCANLPLTGLLMLLSTTVTSMDRQADWVRLMSVALVANLVLDVVLILATQSLFGNGGIGAASAFFFGELIQIGLSLRIMPAGLFDSRLMVQFGRSAVATAFMATAVIAARIVYDPNIALLALLGAAVYGALMLLCGGINIRQITALASEWSALKTGARPTETVEMTAATR